MFCKNRIFDKNRPEDFFFLRMKNRPEVYWVSNLYIESPKFL